jgi:uncharacterized protein (TIGR02246 family)
MRLRPPAPTLLVLTLGLLAGLSCAPSGRHESGGAADLAAIARLRSEYTAARNDGDVQRLMALWTDDAVFMPMDEPTLTGREAIGRHIQDFLDQSPGEIELVPAETRVAGDWAFERGTEIVTMRTDPGGPSATIDVKYLVILKRQPDGSWKYARYIYNLEEPFPESDAPARRRGPGASQPDA